MDSQDYLEVEVAVGSEEIGDIVVAMLGELDFDSFSYEAPSSAKAVYGAQKCYIQTPLFKEDEFSAVIAQLREMTGEDLLWSVRAVPAQNWNSEWEKSGFTPVECGEFIVKPYEEGTSCQDPKAVLLRPQMAFGTGHHHTTFLMMQTMQQMKADFAGAKVMDIGCGTGVLAIVAAKLGAADVSGVDIDAVAVRSAVDSAALNGLQIPFYCCPFSCEGVPGAGEGCYDFLLANIHRNILIDGMPEYARALKEGGRLLLSGFLEEDVQPIVSSASACGLSLANTASREGWFCLAFVRDRSQGVISQRLCHR